MLYVTKTSCGEKFASTNLMAILYFKALGRRHLMLGTCIQIHYNLSWQPPNNPCYRLKPSKPIVDIKPLPVSSFFSDVLFHTWQCSNIDLAQWREILKGDNIPRCSGLTQEEFANQYLKPNLPVLITDVVEKWPAGTCQT